MSATKKNNNDKDHASRAHALCSASGAERWLACPGSVTLCQQVPSGPPSSYALEGTKFHELCEEMIEPLIKQWNKDNKITPKDIQKAYKDVSFDKYSTEMIEYAQEYVDEVFRLIQKHKPKRIFIEERVELFKDLEMFGTADLFFAFQTPKKKYLAVIDIKYGAGKVVEADAPQLIYYGAAVQASFPKHKFDEFWLYVYQPRAEHSDGAFRRKVIKGNKIKKWIEKFITGASHCLEMAEGKRELAFEAGDHCIFCDAKPICKTHASYIDQKAGLDFTDDPAVLVPAVSDQRQEIREFLSDEQICRLLIHRDEIQKFLNSLVEYAMNRYMEGEPIPGWKVVEARGRRKWNIDEVDVTAGLKKLGIEEPHAAPPLRGLGSIEKELKKLGIKDPKKAIESLITMTMPKKSLVEESDSRPGISLSGGAEHDFEVIEQGEVELIEASLK